MSKSIIAYHEYGYEALSRAEARAPHPPTPMLSGNSRGPIKFWVCARPHCGETLHTYQDGEAPVCEGGALWSFTTASGFVAGVHREWLRWER